MSEDRASGTRLSIVYVALLNEGTPVWRPTRAVDLGKGLYRLLPTDDYDSADEEWEFLPGTIVKCALETREGEKILVVRERANNVER